ncbi:MAG: MFS transporter [Planctomycetaceae bacterium]|nr:MFS transporter [Planctomycetaceae bacterium]
MTVRTLHKHYKWELLGLLCCAFFLHQADRAIFGVVLSSIKADLHLTNSQVGLLGTALFVAMALMMPLAGYVGDVFNRKWIVTCSLTFWSAATFCTGLTNGVIGLLFLRSFATALGESFYAPAAYPLLAAFHKATRTIAMSIHQTSLYISLMISGVLAGYIGDHWGWRAAFFLYGGAGILLAGVFVFRLHGAPENGKDTEGPAQRVSPRVAFAILLRTPTAVLITVSYTAVVLVYNGSVIWAPTFLREKYGLTMALAGGLAMFCQYLTSMLGVLLGGMLSDRMVRTRPKFRLQLQSTFMFLCAPAILLMGLAGNLTLTCCGIAALGLCQGIYQSNTPASLFDVIEPRYRSSALGVEIMIAFLIGSVSPWLLGRFRDAFGDVPGLSYGFAAFAGVYVLGGLAVLLALLFTFHRDRCIEAE